jgi:hypothetical protein
MKRTSVGEQKHRAAEGKNKPVAKTVNPSIQQNAEAQPRAKADKAPRANEGCYPGGHDIFLPPRICR